jgi:hypothetical protein
VVRTERTDLVRLPRAHSGSGTPSVTACGRHDLSQAAGPSTPAT